MSYNSFLIVGAREVTITVICTIPPSLHWRGGKMGHKCLTKHHLFLYFVLLRQFWKYCPKWPRKGELQSSWVKSLIQRTWISRYTFPSILMAVRWHPEALKCIFIVLLVRWKKNLFTQSWIMIWAQPFKIIWKTTLFITHHIYANT